MSELIANYAESLRRSLSFDRRSADRLAEEAVDHLHEALAHDRCCQPEEAARQAIRRFGAPSEIVAAYTAQVFPAQLRTTWQSGILLGGLVILTMWLRRTLDLLAPLDQFSVSSMLLFADTIGFRMAIAAGVIAWLLSIGDEKLRRVSLTVQMLVAAAVVLSLSVVASLVIALMAAAATEWSSSSIIAMGSTLMVCGVMIPLASRIRMLNGYARVLAKNGLLAS